MTTKTATWGAETSRSGITATLSTLFAAFTRSRSKRRTNFILADLDDHTLDDIGLHPSQVRRTRQGLTDWVIQTQSGTSRIIFIGR
jgi:uncharacterized protein YjiS (DUF1127 family)